MERGAWSASRARDTGTGMAIQQTVGPVKRTGWGSGLLSVCLALVASACGSDSRVVATDISPAALDVARANARARDASSVEFVQVSADEFVPAQFTGVDLIVSNPPYVPERDRQSLPADVRNFEPHAAVFGGVDGLDLIRLLIPAAARSLAPGGMLLLEIGSGQAGDVRGLLAAAGLELVDLRPDLQGIPRILIVRA